MGFSWLTFIAQIVNLFVLVWLLKRFLYQPIVATIAKRQAYIENKVKVAEEAAKQAEKQQATLRRQNDLWQKEEQNRLEELYQEITDRRKEQEEQIRSEGVMLRQKMQEDLNREAASLQLEIRNMVVQNFLHLSKKVLTDFSELAPLAQTIALFQKKMKELSDTEWAALRKQAKNTTAIQISTSEKLVPADKRELTTYFTKQFGNVPLTFQINPDLILGLEVMIGETILEWNLKTYLDSFDDNLKTALAGVIVKE